MSVNQEEFIVEGQASYTVAEFCQQYRVSKVLYYSLKKQGDGPDELHVGRRRIITHAAALAWEQRMAERHHEIGPSLTATTPSAPEPIGGKDDLVKKVATLQRQLESANSAIATLFRKLDFEPRDAAPTGQPRQKRSRTSVKATPVESITNR